MKFADVKVGESYGYALYKGGRLEKVTILNNTIKVKNGYWSNSQLVRGFLAEDAKGDKFPVLAKSLYCTWAEEEQRRKVAADRTRDTRWYLRRGRFERAAAFHAAERMLEALGAELVDEWIPQGSETAGSGGPEVVAQHLAELGYHAYLDQHDHVHVLHHGALGFGAFGRALTIPPGLVAPLAEAAGVFL